jgi:hypothetical protein
MSFEGLNRLTGTPTSAKGYDGWDAFLVRQLERRYEPFSMGIIAHSRG